jgi:hypothetical protein
MKCTNPLVGENEQYEVNKTHNEYVKVNFEFQDSDKDKEIARTYHLLCNPCVDSILRQDLIDSNKKKKLGANINLPPQVKYIQCKICDNEHTVLISEWNKLFRKPCCDTCVIY